MSWTFRWCVLTAAAATASDCAGAGSCEDAALIQIGKPYRMDPDWHSDWDLDFIEASQTLPTSDSPVLLNGQQNPQLSFFSAIPSFGEDGNFIALLMDFRPEIWEKLRQQSFYCSGKDGAHRTEVRIFGDRGPAAFRGMGVEEMLRRSRKVLAFICDWPAEEAQQKHFEVFLESNGTQLGSVKAKQQSHLLKQYDTAACVRDIFYSSDATDNAPYKMLLQWLEFNQMHGIGHFFVYTFEEVQEEYKELLLPYMKAGLVTRVHFRELPNSHRSRHYRLLNDCLYRAKNHVRWLLPTMDSDEYFKMVSPEKLFPKRAMPADYLKSVWDGIVQNEGKRMDEVSSISFDFYRFRKAPKDQLDINSVQREAMLQKAPWTRKSGRAGWPKYACNVKQTHTAYIHWASDVNNGTENLEVPSDLLVVNHYRSAFNHPDAVRFEGGLPENITDDTLAQEVPALRAALQRRFGGADSGDVAQLLGRYAALHPPPDRSIRDVQMAK